MAAKLQRGKGGPPSVAAAGKSGRRLDDYATEIEAELNKDAYSSALIAAAKAGDKEMAALVLADGENINHSNSEGKTALHVAVEGRKTELSVWLLSRGADPFIQDASGRDCSKWIEDHMGIRACKEKMATAGAGAMPAKDVEALAEHLGISNSERKELLYIAEAALNAQVPHDWAEHCDSNGAVFFYNKQNGQSTWEHPMDPFYKLLVQRAREQKKWDSGAGASAGGRSNKTSTSRTHASATPTDSVLSSMQTPHQRSESSDTRGGEQSSGGGGGKQHHLPSWRHDGSTVNSSPGSKSGDSPVKDSPPKGAAGRTAADEFDVDQILGVGKHRDRFGGPQGGRGADDLLSAIRSGKLDAVDEVNAKERLRRQAMFPPGKRSVVEKLSLDVVSLRGQYEGFRRMVKQQMNVDAEMSILRMAVYRMVNTVRHADANAKAAEELALRERGKYEQIQSEMQEIRGNIRVFCRVRKGMTTNPLNERGDAAAVSFPADDAVCLRDGDTRRTFHFDRVYDQTSTQSQVYGDCRPLIASAMEGFNTCVFAYGQTGSGKTYTMEGPVQDPGIHFRAVKDMFDMKDTHRAVRAYEFTVSVIEVHNERIFDLLVDPRTAAERRKSKQSDLVIKVDIVRGVVVEGLTEFPVIDIQSMVEAIELAAGNRTVGVTAANEHSSRSHLIVTVGVKGQALATGKKWHGKLHLVDLAGSERLDKSGDGRADETRAINKSLTALHDVFAALAKHEKHVPYRNSKLTMMLQDSLAGNSKVLMLLAVSPRKEDVRESISSCTLAKRVKGITLGGAKREVENREYMQIAESHEKRVDELRARVASLEGQLRTALGAAKANADDKTRNKSLDGKRRAEERKLWLEEREKLEKAKAKAEELATQYKVQLVRASAAVLPADPRDGHAFRPQPPPGAYGGRQLMGAGREAYHDDVDRSYAGSAMGSVADRSVWGGNAEENARVHAWKAKVAELKMALEERERREKKLSIDLRRKVEEVMELKERLAAAERRVAKQLDGGGGGGNLPLYERINHQVHAPQHVHLPMIPHGGGEAYPRQPQSDRSDYHRRRRHDPEGGRMMQIP